VDLEGSAFVAKVPAAAGHLRTFAVRAIYAPTMERLKADFRATPP
jgi:hypothetical protein